MGIVVPQDGFGFSGYLSHCRCNDYGSSLQPVVQMRRISSHPQMQLKNWLTAQYRHLKTLAGQAPQTGPTSTTRFPAPSYALFHQRQSATRTSPTTTKTTAPASVEDGSTPPSMLQTPSVSTTQSGRTTLATPSSPTEPV
ncbi:hypothetical protein B5807_10094 [Epicoccum nigrum]|uniref:Uncharacterized protein n=1 Tax=Epicoccum nigrum TaxID=105696 RepID=A0A1Y2LW02_EPING|nr:hypothetical protein B5807_10094 [Epicoccum nigrum]